MNIGKPLKSAAADNAVQDYHVPVLLSETLEGLNVKQDGVYVDCTLGGGGHTNALLKQLGANGKLLVFDQDEDAKKNVPDDERVIFVPQNFKHLQKFLRLHNYPLVDGIMADLGVSSHQFDEAERGFSTRFDAPLDMRMDVRQPLRAADILQTYSEHALHKMFEKYGEVTNAKTLAATIVAQRQNSTFTSINQFKQALHSLVKGNPNKYFAQVFQALRIEANDEMGALETMLVQAITVLKPAGRLAVITFHSVEDRLVKQLMKAGDLPTLAEDIFGHRPTSPMKLINKKPITASQEELKINPRSRSAKLRIAEKK